jgi:hypothetical protein
MSDTDLIRRGDALDVLTDWSLDPVEAIAKMRALPAVQPAPVTVEKAARVLLADLNSVKPVGLWGDAWQSLSVSEGYAWDRMSNALRALIPQEKPHE